MLSKNSILILAILFAIAVVALGSLPFLDTWSKIKVTQTTRSNGDTIIERLTPGPDGLFEVGSPTIQLYIVWHDTNSKELFYDGPANFYLGSGFISWHDAKAGMLAVQIRDRVFSRSDQTPQKWQTWSFMTPKRQPLYDYLKTRIANNDSKSNIREIQTEQGKRLELKGEFVWIGDPHEQTWNLPYDVGSIDFENDLLVAQLRQPIAGLPHVLVFSSPKGTLNDWEFDPIKTAQAEASP